VTEVSTGTGIGDQVAQPAVARTATAGRTTTGPTTARPPVLPRPGQDDRLLVTTEGEATDVEAPAQLPAPDPRGDGTQAPAPVTGDDLPYRSVRHVLDHGGPTMVFQPLLSLTRLEVSGYEALARFPGSPLTDSERWFMLAHDVGLGAALEAAAVGAALRARNSWPSNVSLSVNLSPSVLDSRLVQAVLPRDLTGIEIEVTEHESVPDIVALRQCLDRLRSRGARIAVDDVGAGHSGLRRVMDLAPDCIKLDRHLVTGIAGNKAKAALVRAVVDFADRIGATVCAEGVETVPDLLSLADLDVALAQGWAVGPPTPTAGVADPAAVAACERSLERVLAGGSARGRGEGLDRRLSLEDLFGRLADVVDLDDLASLASSAAAVLGCDETLLSHLTEDGYGVQALAGGIRVLDREVYPLAHFPATRTCMDEHVVVPVYEGDRRQPAEVSVLRRLGYASVLLVPVSSRGRSVGLLECYRADRGPWARRHIRSARLLASVLGPVLDGLRHCADPVVAATRPQHPRN
jgi:EAL domain-containing protein (putative c-di-GMP-specific phosphodiesterase class I)